jgi:thiamine kinase-like enzyme
MTTPINPANPAAAAGVRVAGSLTELLAELDDRQLFKTSDSLSGSRFESVRYRGVPMILKYVSVDDDWIMRATGDIDCRVLRLFASDTLTRLPRSLDHVTVAVAPFESRHGHTGAAVLLHDVAGLLVPPGSDVIPVDTHRRFIEHMAELHAAYWDFEDTIALNPMAHHYVFLTPTMATLEAAHGGGDPVPKAVEHGWAAINRMDSELSTILTNLASDPSPLVRGLEATPQTFVHGDWKYGNLGEHADGRTVLLDWDRCGAAPATFDLAWYLAVNCDRLPESKEATIALYRHALERHGIETSAWWDTQLALTLLGAGLQLLWSKVGDPTEFGWWRDRVNEGERFLA